LKTTAAILERIGTPLVLRELTIPALKDGQVLVQIVYSGICHTQLLEMQGARGEDSFLPHTLGHEGSGIVVETTPSVTKVKPGDHVVLTWISGEGCAVGSTEYVSPEGKVNSGAIRTFMQHTVISENRLVKIDPSVSLRTAALFGCAVPTGAGCVFRSLEVTGIHSIAVFGVGGVGASAILAAKARSLDTIIAVDIFKAKLDFARELGATHVINAVEGNLPNEIFTATGSAGADLTIDASGSRSGMEMAFRSAKLQGGTCVIAGNLPHGETINIDPYDLIRGKRIIGTAGGETVPDRDIPYYLDLTHQGLMPAERLITGVYPLEQINNAFRDLEAGIPGRLLIEVNHQVGEPERCR